MNKRNLSSSTAFLDFFMLQGMVFLFLFAVVFMMMNPVAKQADVKLQTAMMIQMEWNSSSTTDMDLWVKGPDSTLVGYSSKDGRYMHLARDDLGAKNDTIVVNGQEQVIQINQENTSVTYLQPGEYVVDCNYYSGKAPEEKVKVTITLISPYHIVFQRELTVHFYQEETAVSFIVTPDGQVVDLNTDVTIHIARQQ